MFPGGGFYQLLLPLGLAYVPSMLLLKCQTDIQIRLQSFIICRFLLDIRSSAEAMMDETRDLPTIHLQSAPRSFGSSIAAIFEGSLQQSSSDEWHTLQEIDQGCRNMGLQDGCSRLVGYRGFWDFQGLQIRQVLKCGVNLKSSGWR